MIILRDYDIIRVFRFIRWFIRLSVRDLSKCASPGAKFSRSLIELVEHDMRYPQPEFIQEYARILQEKSKLTHDITQIAEQCVNDIDFMYVLESQENGDHSISTIHFLAEFIARIEDSSLVEMRVWVPVFFVHFEL